VWAAWLPWARVVALAATIRVLNFQGRPSWPMSLEREGPDGSARTSGGGGLRGGEQGGGAAAEQVMGDNWIVGSRGRDEESPARAYATRLVLASPVLVFSAQWFKRSVQTGKTLVSLPQLSTSPL